MTAGYISVWTHVSAPSKYCFSPGPLVSRCPFRGKLDWQPRKTYLIDAGFWRNVSVFKYDHRKKLQVKKGSSNSRRFLDNNNQWTVTTFRSLRVLNRAESLHLWNFQGYLCVLWLPRKKSATSEGRDVQGNVPPQKSPWPQEVASARHVTPIRWSTFLYFYFP